MITEIVRDKQVKRYTESRKTIARRDLLSHAYGVNDRYRNTKTDTSVIFSNGDRIPHNYDIYRTTHIIIQP